jgi:molecular chaperone DnaK
MRTTIDFGIDLGTTNSTPAVIDGTKAKVIANKVGASITPSAVWIDKRGTTIVGQLAKVRALTDPEEMANADVEFKLRMGLGHDGGKHFKRSDRHMLPEELSAEVLKELRRDIRTATGEEIRAVVITVPANFGLDQSNATVKAASMAGFGHSPLLLEPVAASLAYGFQSQAKNEYWMVYDFGGGTFDAAIMQIRHGQINVFNHAGDNKLGGKDLDWDIVTEILAPEFARQSKLSDFTRGVQKWVGAMGKLKWLAELAKIEVCRTLEPYEIYHEELYKDQAGQSVSFAYTLTPEQVQKLSEPYIVRSLRLCAQALSEKGLSGKDMTKIIMVGGSTLNPWVRERVADTLKAPLEFSIDPVTVVAQGAAIFASTKEIPDAVKEKAPEGTWLATLIYDKTGRDLEPPIAGKISPPDGTSQNPEGFTLEFVDIVSSWRSGKMLLGGTGEFETMLLAEADRRCEYRLELCDARGTMLRVSPETCAYTYGVGVGDQAIIAPHTISVGLADNSTRIYVPRGGTLPLDEAVEFKAAKTVRAGSNDTLRIPLLQGQSPRADRNLEVAVCVISGTNLTRTLAEGSDIEVRVHMDENQTVTMEALFRQIDHLEDLKVELGTKAFTIEQLRTRFDQQKLRLSEGRGSPHQTPETRAALAKIDAEEIVPQCERMLHAAEHDPGVRATLNERLLTLASMLDEVEEALSWPLRIKEAQEAKDEARRIVREYGKPEHNIVLQQLESELAAAIESRTPALVATAVRQLYRFAADVAFDNLIYLSRRLNSLEAEKQKMKDLEKAEQLIAQARRAIHNGDIDQLRACVFQLDELLITTGGGGGGVPLVGGASGIRIR